MLIDTHSHLDLEEDILGLLEKCKQNLVTEIISISTDLESSKKNIEISSNFKNIFSSVGFHPASIKNVSKNLDCIEKLGISENCKAIGEIGLDFFYEGYNKDLQFEFFSNQIDISEKLNKPFVVHCRQAYSDAIDFLKRKNPKVQFVFHCFTEDYDTAKKVLDLGGLISFTGIVTFKKSYDLREVIKKIPIDTFMIETDSPYLSPEPKRGKKNNSSNLIYIAQCIANIINKPFEETAEQIRLNSVKFFNI
ncbi:hydrolase TatD [bacterium]|nr:TatD family hydrolase [Thermodesulfobacteriota bacterium]GIR29502.1 MAG: hydrolase TatD [bacterium]|tara:strand:+ start:17480 stop:18229 length:750 start_codon:yes stop_codon:yes gene_type:complete